MNMNLDNPKLTAEARKILQMLNDRFGGRIQDLYQPEVVILFGSFVHGTQDEWSDVDLLLVSTAFASTPKIRRRSTFLLQTGLVEDEELFIEPLCVTPSEFNRAVHLASIQQEALRSGIVLLDRTGLTEGVLLPSKPTVMQ